MTDAYIYDHVRSPRGRGKQGGSLNSITPMNLTTQVLRALRDRNDLDTSLLDDVILGCVTPVGEQGANIARVAAIMADYAESVPGKQINRFCSSGLEAVNTAAAQVMSGQSDAAVGGGLECMSRVPMGSDGGAWALDPETNLQLAFVPQGIGADLIATLEDFEREQIDTYALRSQQRATEARAAGRFANSVVAVHDGIGGTILGEDEFIKPHTTLEGLASLKASFEEMGRMGYDAVALQRYPQVERIRHVHTAGNSSGIVDGAAALVVTTGENAGAHGWKPKARILEWDCCGVDPSEMGIGPAPASQKLLARTGRKISDVDVIELNEAFASQALATLRELGVADDAEHVNPNGGAIALGHPLGMSGTRLALTAVLELQERKAKRALCMMCIGVGQGISLALERVA